MKAGVALLLIAAMLSVSACGRKAAPKPLGNSLYPLSYPPKPVGETWTPQQDTQGPNQATQQQ